MPMFVFLLQSLPHNWGFSMIELQPMIPFAVNAALPIQCNLDCTLCHHMSLVPMPKRHTGIMKLRISFGYRFRKFTYGPVSSILTLGRSSSSNWMHVWVDVLSKPTSGGSTNWKPTCVGPCNTFPGPGMWQRQRSKKRWSSCTVWRIFSGQNEMFVFLVIR